MHKRVSRKQKSRPSSEEKKPVNRSRREGGREANEQMAPKITQKPPSRGLYTPKPVQDRVVAKAIEGKSNRQVAREEGMDNHTVGKILSQREVQERLAGYRQELLGKVPKALKVYDYHLVRNDQRVATAVLEGTQALVKRSESKLEVQDEELANRSKEDLVFYAENGYWPEQGTANG